MAQFSDVAAEGGNDDRLHGLAAIADHLGVPLRTLQSWSRAGQFPHAKIGKTILASKRELAAWLDQHRRGPRI